MAKGEGNVNQSEEVLGAVCKELGKILQLSRVLSSFVENWTREKVEKFLL